MRHEDCALAATYLCHVLKVYMDIIIMMAEKNYFRKIFKVYIYLFSMYELDY